MLAANRHTVVEREEGENLVNTAWISIDHHGFALDLSGTPAGRSHALA